MKPSHPEILAVDDDPNDLIFLLSAFRAIGVTSVHTVEGGNEAIAYLAGEGKFSDRGRFPYPDVVIADLKMPGGDGFAVLEHFKRNPVRAVIPMVILSGSYDNDDITKAYLLGANSYHVKPSDPTALRALVKSIYEYWLGCEVPAVDQTGRRIPTHSAHKLGERFN